MARMLLRADTWCPWGCSLPLSQLLLLLPLQLLHVVAGVGAAQAQADQHLKVLLLL